jgi:hypothetical protein
MMQRIFGSGAEYHLYVVEKGNHRVQVFNPVDGSPIRCIGEGEGAGPGQLYYPISCEALLEAEEGIAELYVSEYGNNRVSVFDMATGAFKRHIGAGDGDGGLRQPQGLALSLGGVDSQGGDHLLYVSELCNDEEEEDEAKGRIHILNATTGAHVGYLGEGELGRPRGIRLHAATENRTLLFVTDCVDNNIRIYEV